MATASVFVPSLVSQDRQSQCMHIPPTPTPMRMLFTALLVMAASIHTASPADTKLEHDSEDDCHHKEKIHSHCAPQQRLV